MGNNKKKKVDAYDFMKVDDTSHKQFINEWYSHPETKRRLRNAFTTPSDKSLNKLYSLGESYAQITGKNPFSPELNSQVDSLINTSLNKINNAEGYYEFPDQLTKKYSGVNENTLGFTLKNNPENYIVNRNNKYKNRSIPLHELTHISGLDVFNDSNFKNSEDLLLKHSKNLTDYKKYLINEPEVYPRVMEIRFNNKIKPGQIIKKGDIDTNHRSFQELMKIYNNEDEVYDILNTMANNTEVSDNLVQSMNGGKINNMKKKKYFIGGVVNQGIQGVTQDMPDNSGKIIGGAAQFGIGAATGNPQDMIGGGIGMLSGGFNNAKEMFNNKDANFMDKALAAYGVINPVAGVASSFRNKALTERQQQDDVMNNIIKQNNMMANGGNLPPSEFQQYRNPYGNLQPLQNTLPYTPHPLDLEAIPPQRYNPFTPMEGITQPISNEPIDIENQWAKLPRNILDPTNKIYEMFSTNNYSGVPTSINSNTGRQHSLSDLAGARNEQKRNQDILNYLTQSKQTAQEIQNHKQQHPEYFVDPGTYAGNLQSYLTSEAGQNKLSEALGDFDNINLGQRTTNPTYHAEGGMLNRFDGGFTHNDPSAQNSFEGIPIARGDNGETHVVENGEASLPTPDGNQYIFSDQNKLTKNLAKQLNIANKYVGKTFAQIAKSYEDNTRKGDSLDKKTFDLNIERLMAANEQAKQISEIGEVYKMAKGGKLNINKYDGGSWLEFLNKYKTQAFYPENGIPYRYNDELGTTLTMDNTSNINNVNNNKQVITENALPYNADFFDSSSPSLPYNTPSHTRRGYYGNNLQDQNAWIKTQLTPENINNWINPESPLNKGIDWRQNLIKEIQTNQPKLYNALLNGEVPEDKLIELYVESENGPIQSLVTSPYEHMVRRDVKLKNPDPILEIPKKSTTTKDEEETPTKNPPNLPNLWPELGLAGNLGAMAMLDPTYMTPSTMSTGYQDYNPLDVNKSDIAGNVSNMIAGMGASGNPYNILASGLQGMKGLDSAQQQANIYNLQDRSNVDARNIGVQDVVGARNLQYLNQANAMNTGIANQTNRELADTFASAVGNYSGAGNDRYYSNQGADFWGRATGYDPRTALYLLAMQNNNKPVEETKASAYGGVIKTRKRKLK